MINKSNYYVMVVDDEEDILDMLQEIIEELGFNVVTAPNGEKAWELILTKKYNIFLVLSDVKMPHMDGVTLLQKIKKDIPEIPVVMIMSGYSDVSPKEVLEMGSLAFFHKPFDEEKMEEVINKVFDQYTTGKTISLS